MAINTTTLQIAIAVAIFFVGFFLAERGRHVHGFRNFDMIFYQHARLAVAHPSDVGKAHKDIAKQYLKRSVDYRRIAVYHTFQTLYAIFGMMCFILALVLSSFSELFTSIFFIAGGIFLVLAFLGLLRRYGRLKSLEAYDRISWLLSEKFPPWPRALAPSHFLWWDEVGAFISDDADYEAYLEMLNEYQDIKR